MPGALLQQLKDTPEYSRRMVLLNHIGAIIGEMLELNSAEPLRADDKLFEIGLKSRMLIELRTRLETAFSVVLPVTLFFAYSTLGMLTDHLLAEILKMPSRGEARGDARSMRPDRGRGDLEGIKDLSEEEAEARLLDRIAEVKKTIKV